MDALADVFETLQLRGSFYFRTDFSPPWGTTVPRLGRAARFHYVLKGNCWIQVEGMEPLKLETGDFVLVPNGASHILTHEPSSEAPPLEEVMNAVGYKRGFVLAVGPSKPQAATQLVCGHMTFREGADHLILRALPKLIRIGNVDRVKRPWFDEVLRLLVNKVFSSHPGSIAVVTRLSEIVFIESVRFAGDEAPVLKRMMEAFNDDRIGRSIVLIHSDPAHPFTVDSLAREIGMSRTRFAEKFQEMIGVGPMSYLSEWRLQLALSEIASSRLPINEIARKSGYGSAASFSRAFAARFGKSPKEFRI